MIFYTKSFMKEETKKLFRQVGYASTIGLTVAFSIVIGAGLGFWLSGVFGLPILFPVFLVLGGVAAYRNYGRLMKKIRKDE